ncbi:olfactory receptor 855 [Mus musculus]|jgi:olfactory receptor|uniref:Olfactory receptor n=1 Tax=Mus musculus TaxID=10090 RepID=Q7TRF8_MOUSE|nr:olfactory receptor 855 [Mus musculus]AAP71334.1 olfactory receptor Olfr855 [Mus musculus]EDL25073.1 olfactory receptor 855 [Mus musculus]|eukprot:NP_666735.2 olfactory receptor 855 [Mus musculus]
MEPQNKTFVLQFLLLGFTDDAELQCLIFSLFLFIYLVTILGNLLIILCISSESHLQTPMYFFLSNLSFNDIGLSTATVIKMLVNIQANDQSITYTDCLTQLFFVLAFAYFENFLLTVMAYDRYAAICHPLRYNIIMNPNLCVLLSLNSLFISVMDSLIHTLMVQRLSFCTDLEIPHFFCELDQVIKLSCSDTRIDNIVLFVATCVFGGVPLCGIIYSYYHIMSTILKIASLEGKYKAFSTCGTHLSVVSLFYGAGSMVYISSAISASPGKSAVASVMYSVLPQMMNPFIYSLRNKDMKVAIRNLFSRTISLE